MAHQQTAQTIALIEKMNVRASFSRSTDANGKSRLQVLIRCNETNKDICEPAYPADMPEEEAEQKALEFALTQPKPKTSAQQTEDLSRENAELRARLAALEAAAAAKKPGPKPKVAKASTVTGLDLKPAAPGTSNGTKSAPKPAGPDNPITGDGEDDEDGDDD